MRSHVLLHVVGLILLVVACDTPATSTRHGSGQVGERSASDSSAVSRQPAHDANHRPIRPDQEQVLEAAYRQLFSFRTHSLQGASADLLFVGVGKLGQMSDPSPALVANLGTPELRVRAQSESVWDVQRGVRDRATGKLGLLFYADTSCVANDQVFVRAGYFEHGKSGMRFIFLLERVDGVWTVVEVGQTAVS